MIFLLHTIWRVRQDFLRTLGSTVSYRELEEHTLVKYKLDVSQKKQKRRITDQLASFLEDPPPEAALYFTDGSASPNPGPSGAGVFRPAGPLPTLSTSVHLGHGSNNEAELYAIGSALRSILEGGGVGYSCIFTDSDYAHGILERNNRVTKHKELAKAVKDLLHQARGVGTVFLVWIKAHAGHEGNERADTLAKEGASGVGCHIDLGKEHFLCE